VVSWSHLVQTEHLARRVVELVMVDFDVCKGCIELYIDIALPGRELEGCHGEGAGGVSWCLLVRGSRMRCDAVQCLETMYPRHISESRGTSQKSARGGDQVRMM
jgi:hypothetical protein